MKAKINQVGIITSQFDLMLQFYEKVLGFQIKLQLENYVEFENEGVRFAIASNQIMYDITSNQTFLDKKSGQSLELAFEVSSPKEVDKIYNKLLSLGAKPIKEPNFMPWGHRAAFFADPDNNIHEIFAPC